MRKYSYSYSIGEPTEEEIKNAVKLKWDRDYDVMRFEDGSVLYLYHDGRFYDDNGNHWEEIYYADDEDDLDTSLGFVQREWNS